MSTKDTVKSDIRTKTYTIPITRNHRWKLTPEDSTIIKLSLSSWKSSHKELEKRKKSLLSRMRGDFFMVLYAPGRHSPSSEMASECNCEKVRDEGMKKAFEKNYGPRKVRERAEKEDGCIVSVGGLISDIEKMEVKRKMVGGDESDLPL
jgi:hypothetical protein